MPADLKQMTEFLRSVGAAAVGHTDKTYLAHVTGVYRDLQDWGADADLCAAAIFHSIYGTEKFQLFTLPVERREEIRELIGERAENLAYWNCMMDRAFFDREAARPEPPFRVRHRLTGEVEQWSPQDFDDLCRLHLCDWLEQVPRSREWDYRREGYEAMAHRLGGVALDAFQRVFAAAR